MRLSESVYRGLYGWYDELKERGDTGTGEYIIGRKRVVEDGGIRVVVADEGNTEFYAVYAARKDGAGLWIADFADYDDAAAFALLRGEARRGCNVPDIFDFMDCEGCPSYSRREARLTPDPYYSELGEAECSDEGFGESRPCERMLARIEEGVRGGDFDGVCIGQAGDAHKRLPCRRRVSCGGAKGG
jgi:hypothetical protein